MNSFIVVWQDADYTIATVVEIPADKNSEDLSNKDWINLAAEMEGYTPDEIADLLEEDLKLFAVVKGKAEHIIM